MPDDGFQLRKALRFAEDDLRRPLAQLAVVVDERDADVFEGQVVKALEPLVDREASLGDGAEQGFQFGCVHGPLPGLRI
jgi:hypothetical protein